MIRTIAIGGFVVLVLIICGPFIWNAMKDLVNAIRGVSKDDEVPSTLTHEGMDEEESAGAHDQRDNPVS